MSIFKRLAVQNGVAVIRDGDGNVVTSTNLQAHELAAKQKGGSPATVRRMTWRGALRKLTNDGNDLMEILYNLAQGLPQVVQLPDGRQSEPIIPTPDVRRAAAADLLDRLHGKAVAQTEVLRAEQEAEDHAQYAALSDAELLKAVEDSAWRKAAAKREALTEGEDE